MITLLSHLPVISQVVRPLTSLAASWTSVFNGTSNWARNFTTTLRTTIQRHHLSTHINVVRIFQLILNVLPLRCIAHMLRIYANKSISGSAIVLTQMSDYFSVRSWATHIRHSLAHYLNTITHFSPLSCSFFSWYAVTHLDLPYNYTASHTGVNR